jgi:alpha-L-glutamate ligase-like protein
MPKAQHILGMNARVQIYTVQNSYKAKRYGFSKLRAKHFLQKHQIQVPQLYAQLSSLDELREFDWHTISGGFAIKPANGVAGSGIMVIKRRRGDTWFDIENNQFSQDDLYLHASDILDGQYSTWGSTHQVIIEERIPIHPDLESFAEVGTPDIRVIVYRKIPAMAMLRLPTRASHGRANLHQGAIALGIDFGTGKTTYGVDGNTAYSHFGNRALLKTFPNSDVPIAGLEIPFWDDVLKIAVRTANATGLKYMGADIFLHPEKGPMIAEVNTYPGLSIQLANKAGLRQRLEKIEDISARNVTHAVKIAQALFAENYPASSLAQVDRPIIGTKEKVIVYDDHDKPYETIALVNTGRYRSIIAENLASQLELNEPHDELWQQSVDSEGSLPIVQVPIKIKDRIIVASMAVSKRLNKKRPQIEIGRKDLSGFLVVGDEQ